MLVKWSKTMQNNNEVKLISVNRIAGSPLCPVCAIPNLLALSPKGSNLPLFQFKQNSNWVPLTDIKVRRHFSSILSRLDLDGSGYTLHTFRRSDATFAFNDNVALQNIQRHGTWTLDYVWRYITDDVNARDQVAEMFKMKLSTSWLYSYAWGLAG